MWCLDHNTTPSKASYQSCVGNIGTRLLLLDLMETQYVSYKSILKYPIYITPHLKYNDWLHIYVFLFLAGGTIEEILSARAAGRPAPVLLGFSPFSPLTASLYLLKYTLRGST